MKYAETRELKFEETDTGYVLKSNTEDCHRLITEIGISICLDKNNMLTLLEHDFIGDSLDGNFKVLEELLENSGVEGLYNIDTLKVYRADWRELLLKIKAMWQNRYEGEKEYTFNPPVL